MTPDLRVFADPAALAAAAAEEFFLRASRAHAEGRSFSCALSGGRTPAAMLQIMSEDNSLRRPPAGSWNDVHFFWGDERYVPPGHPDSNYRMAREALLDKIEIPEGNIHRIRTESGTASAAATLYEEELARFFRLCPGAMPRFDLIFLGMGEDGHVASIFPHSEVLAETTRLVASPWVEKVHSYRITLTLPVINNAGCILFLVQGGEKAATLRRVLMDAPCPEQLPAQAVRPGKGDVVWFVDQSAAPNAPCGL